MHLDRRLQRVVRQLDIGIASADVGHHDAVLAPELSEQGLGGVSIGRLIVAVDHLGMRGAVDVLALVAVVHVAIAADGSVGGPFVAGNAHEPTGRVEFAGRR